MPRGKPGKDGDTNVSANGYHYTRSNGKWRLTHHLTAEKALGRPLLDTETVRFKDGDKTNYMDPDNVVVIAKKHSVAAQRAKLEAKMMELQDQLNALDLLET